MKLILNNWLPKDSFSSIQTTSLEENNYNMFKLCDVIYDKLLNRYTSSDEEVTICSNLALKINELRFKEEPEEVEFTDEEYYYIRESLQDEKLVIKAQFLLMVNTLNPTSNDL